MKTLITMILAVGLLSTWPGQAAPRQFVVGVEDQNYLPVYAHARGVYTGYAREVLDAFAKDRGYVFEYRPLPVPRLYAAFLNGQVDFKFPDNPNWKKDQRGGRRIAYSEPVAAFIDGVSVRANATSTGPEAIGTLGILAGFTPWAWLDRIQAGKVRLVENASFEGLVRQALTGRVDGVYANVAVIHYQLDKVIGQPGALKFDAGLPYSRDYYHLSSLTQPEVVAEFDAWLKRNRARVTEMKKRHAVEKGVIAN